MRDPEKLKEEMDERNRKILDVAFELFVDKKIEAGGKGCRRGKGYIVQVLSK